MTLAAEWCERHDRLFIWLGIRIMRRRATSEERARSFAENFDAIDRPGVEEWYREKLHREGRERLWLWVRAGLVVAIFTIVMPSVALWALLAL